MSERETLVDLVNARLDRLEERLKESGVLLPEEPQTDGSVIVFQYRFNPSGVKYMYAAIRAKGLWYTTGPQSTRGYEWREFVEWLRKGNVTKARALDRAMLLDVGVKVDL